MNLGKKIKSPKDIYKLMRFYLQNKYSKLLEKRNISYYLYLFFVWCPIVVIIVCIKAPFLIVRKIKKYRRYKKERVSFYEKSPRFEKSDDPDGEFGYKQQNPVSKSEFSHSEYDLLNSNFDNLVKDFKLYTSKKRNVIGVKLADDTNFIFDFTYSNVNYNFYEVNCKLNDVDVNEIEDDKEIDPKSYYNSNVWEDDNSISGVYLKEEQYESQIEKNEKILMIDITHMPKSTPIFSDASINGRSLEAIEHFNTDGKLEKLTVCIGGNIFSEDAKTVEIFPMTDVEYRQKLKQSALEVMRENIRGEDTNFSHRFVLA